MRSDKNNNRKTCALLIMIKKNYGILWLIFWVNLDVEENAILV